MKINEDMMKKTIAILSVIIVSQLLYVHSLLAKENPVTPKICIVSSTADDEERFGLFPWPETVEAALIEKLEACDAKTIVVSRLLYANPSDEFIAVLQKHKNIILYTYGFNFNAPDYETTIFFADDFDSHEVEMAKIELKRKTKLSILLLKEMGVQPNDLNSIKKEKLLLALNNIKFIRNPKLYAIVDIEKLGLGAKGINVLKKIKNQIALNIQPDEKDVIMLNKMILQKSYPLTTAKSMNKNVLPPDTSYMEKYAVNNESSSNDYLSFTDMYPLSKYIVAHSDSIGLFGNLNQMGYIEDVPIVMKSRDKIYPSFSLAVVANYLGYANKDVLVADSNIRIGDVTIRIDDKGMMKPVFTKPGEAYTSYTFQKVLDDKVRKRDFKNKIVILTYTSVEPPTYYKTIASQHVRLYEVLIDTINSLFLRLEKK